MVSFPTLQGAALGRPAKFGSTAAASETTLAFQVDVAPDIHVRHTTTVGNTTQQNDVAVKGHVHIESDADEANSEIDSPHPMLAFCQHLLHKVTQQKQKKLPSQQTKPPQSPPDASPPSLMQQLMRDLATGFAQLKGKLRLDLDVDASQLTQIVPEASKTKTPGKPTETLLIPEAGVSGVKGKLNLNVSLKQAQELLTVVEALNHPERCDDTRAAIRSVMYKELSFLEWIQLGLSHLFFAKKWRQSIIRKALETKLNALLPKSSLTLYRPTMQPPVTVNSERTPQPMTQVPAIRFGSTDATPPLKPNEPQTFSLVPATPPDTFVLSYQADSNYDVAVDHRQRTTNGSFTHDAPADGDKPESDETTAHTIRHNNDGTNVTVRVNGPVTSDLQVAGSNGAQGLHGRGHLTVNVGEQKPLHIGVGVTTDTEVLHDNNPQQPFRQVVSDQKLTIDLSGLKDHTAVAVTPTSLDADLKSQLKSGTIVYTSRGQRNGLQDAVQNAGVNPGGVTLEIGDVSVPMEADTPVPPAVRERIGTQRQVTVLLGDAATPPVVKKEGEDKPQPAPQPAGPLQVAYTIAGTRVKQDSSTEVNGTVKANVAVPFRVETSNSSITFTNPEQTQAQVDQTQSRSSSTTTGHVKLDGTGKLRLVLPQLPPPPSDGSAGNGTDGTPPGSGGGGGSNPLAPLSALFTGQIGRAFRQVMGVIQQQANTNAGAQPTTTEGEGATGTDAPQS